MLYHHSSYKGAPGRISAEKKTHWAELGGPIWKDPVHVVVVTGFSIVFSDYMVHHSWINLRPLQGLQDELLISLPYLFNEIINGTWAVQLPQEVWRQSFSEKFKAHVDHKSFRSFRVQAQWIAINAISEVQSSITEMLRWMWTSSWIR